MMSSSQSKNTPRHLSRRRKRHLTCLKVATIIALALVSVDAEDAEEECPRGTNGWTASSDCSAYYWCSAGMRSSMTYTCTDGQKFDVAKSACFHGYECPKAAEAPSTAPSVSPTLPLITWGPPVYYGDFRTSGCQNINDLMQGKPEWVTEEDMFKSKEECCKETFSWVPLENCLGPGFVESNYEVGSRAPTSTPTMLPTTVPSSSPSVSSAPSSSSTLPKEVDSIPPHRMPEPTTKDELTAQADANFLVEMLGWANADMPEVMIPEGSTFDTSSSTSPQVEENNQISELTLPIVSDATVSQNRPDANFGSNTALAVDGGAEDSGSGSEKLDSLLKFDVGMIDSTRKIESAVLKVYALSNCLESTFTTTVDSDWDHQEVTWDTAPSGRGGVLFDTIKDVRQNMWYEIDISRAIEWQDNISIDDSNGSFLSIRMASTESSRCLYSSMESGGAKAPVIVINYLQHEVGHPKPATGQFILLQADADSTISASSPNTVLSKEPTLMVEFDPFTRNIHDTLIRFDLSKTGGTDPRSAILSLFSEISCPSAGTFTTTNGDADWDESSITWSTAPEAGDADQLNGVMIGTFGAVSKNRWHGFDVTQAIRLAILTKKKDVTFRISSGNTESCLYSSIESGREPKLMVSF